LDFAQYKLKFSEEASKAGYTEQNIQRCLHYAEKLFTNNVPVIYNTSHLSALVGYRKQYLKKAVLFTDYFYRDFSVPKRNGRLRTISEPLPSLKEIQLWILKNILYKKPVSPHAKAYRPGMTIMDNLKFHRKQPKVLVMDIDNFFPSIKLKDVTVIFRELGYSNLISSLLAKLCCKDESLPQGAPTSPYLSNIFFNPVDRTISDHCKERKIRYTRYADDLTFSGDFNEHELINNVTKEVSSLSLKINESKTKLMTPNMRQTVTGIVVNEKPQVVFHKRNKLRQDLYYIKKFGLANHIKRKKIKKSNYLEHLIGKVNFILQINPEDKEFQEHKTYLFELKRGWEK
jgi:RNA-directed DNA polymerase